MKKLILLLFTFFNLVFVSFSQTDKKEVSTSFQNIYEEDIYIHTNNDFFITGENILYSISCLNSKNSQPSSLSKIAYIALIGNDLKYHVFQKIKLKDGRGSGDFLVPASLESGSYKVIAYTKWMLNTGKKVFDKNVAIVNPFKNNANIISLDKGNKIYKKNSSIAHKSIGLFKDKNSFYKREKIVVNIKELTQNLPIGNYSILVKKLDSLTPIISNKNAKTIKIVSKKVDSLSFKNGIPEFRGEAIYGKLINKKTGIGISNTSISLSIPGKNYLFKLATTDNYGNFFININNAYNAEEAILRVLNAKEEFSLNVKNITKPELSYLVFEGFKIDKRIKKIIESKSIFNQIENAYYFFKQDSILKIAENKSFYGNNFSEYILNDYTKFKKLKETFIEIVDYVSFVGKDGEQRLRIRDLKPLNTDREPLVLLNGVPVIEHSKIANLNSKNIYKINVLKKNFVYSNEVYKGVIDILGYDNSVLDYIKDDNFKKLNLLKPENEKTYFFPDYSKNDLKRIPDLRSQLYWNPEFVLDKSIEKFSFFTSDNVGEYEFIIEGFSYDGEPVFRKDYLFVIGN